METGEAHDIWHTSSLWAATLVETGQVLELDDYVAAWQYWPDDFYPEARADVTYGEHVYGVPFRSAHRGSPVIYAPLFEKAGLEPAPPTTWDELNEIAPRLTVRDGEVFEQAGINLEHHAQVYEDWLLQAGGNFFPKDHTKPLNNSPAGHTALSQHVRPGLVDFTMPKPKSTKTRPQIAVNRACRHLRSVNVQNGCIGRVTQAFPQALIGGCMCKSRVRGALRAG